MNRIDIKKRMAEKEAEICAIQDELHELYKQDCLLCDDEQWYTTDFREINGVNTEIGIINWKEKIYDGGYPNDESKAILIDRLKIVKVGVFWCE